MRSMGKWKIYCEKNDIRFLDSESIEKKIISAMTKGMEQNKGIQKIYKELSDQLEVSKDEIKEKWHGKNGYKPLKVEWEKQYSNKKKQAFIKDAYTELCTQLNHHSLALKSNETPTRRIDIRGLVSKYKDYIQEEIIIGVVNEGYIMMKKQRGTIEEIEKIFKKRMKEYDSFLINRFSKKQF